MLARGAAVGAGGCGKTCVGNEESRLRPLLESWTAARWAPCLRPAPLLAPDTAAVTYSNPSVSSPSAPNRGLASASARPLLSPGRAGAHHMGGPARKARHGIARPGTEAAARASAKCWWATGAVGGVTSLRLVRPLPTSAGAHPLLRYSSGTRAVPPRAARAHGHAPRGRPALRSPGAASTRPAGPAAPLPPELGARPTGGQAPAVLRPGGLGWGRRLGSPSDRGRGPSRGSSGGSLARRPAGRCGGALARPQLTGRSLPAAHVTQRAPRRLAGGSAPGARPIGRRRASHAPPRHGPAPPRPRGVRTCAAFAPGSRSCQTRTPPNMLPGPRPAVTSLLPIPRRCLAASTRVGF